jgi:hypothetical protein
MNRQINQLHEEAMERMDDALVAQRRGDDQAAQAAFRQAFQLERAAAELLLTLPDQPEPSRSVLLRSAASLARDAGERAEALRLIQLALFEITLRDSARTQVAHSFQFCDEIPAAASSFFRCSNRRRSAGSQTFAAPSGLFSSGYIVLPPFSVHRPEFTIISAEDVRSPKPLERRKTS